MGRLTREASRASTRRRLIEAARYAFARSGYGAVSIDRLSEAAGFSRGAFYGNYDSKQELLLELMAEMHEREIAVWNDLVGGSTSIAMLLPELEKRFDAYAAKRDWWLLHAEFQLEAERNEAFRVHFDAFNRRIFDQLVDLIAGLETQAGRPFTADHVTTAMALRGLAYGLMSGIGTGQEAHKAFSMVLRLLLQIDSFEAAQSPSLL